jgi:tetratricopeptide (TPR) repeat protein
MVDLRPDTSSYARVSYLRSLHGDTEGAIEAMADAVRSASPADPEMVAWCYVHLGDELMTAGRRDQAEGAYDRALQAFPDYHAGLAGKARARVAAGDPEAAVELYAKSLGRVPLPETAIALGDLYRSLGRAEEAKRAYALVEAIERASAGEAGLYSRQLALFWADHDVRLDEALAIAERERATRSDVFTCDTLAWCLYKKGRYEEAKVAIDEALRLGTRDPRMSHHAERIAEALGETTNDER